ncbi:hypothetical protein SASPL_108103 [Salvia splendens]|uniref:hAT-like transposase RNase-H fold domain-containing protein n=1 Tax=Salvia splendens TaxID=180675 RepID=A0A8X8YEQ3_SALSN|nr:hypothetical protein SASPL_108103 [Salvia splendens]
MAESQSGRSPNCPNISPSPLNTQQDSNILLNDQDLEDVSILKDIEEEDVDVDVSQSRSKKRKTEIKKEPRSVHWKDYERVKVMEGNPPIEVVKGKCKRCEVLIAADPRWCGTNGLKNHTLSCSKKFAQGEGSNKGQTVLNYVVDATSGNSSLTSWKFDQKASRLALCEMIILDEQPFRMVEYEGFRRFCKTSIPQLQLPSRQTIRTDCVKLFLERKHGLAKYFKKEGMGRVSITSDCWTAVNNSNFICVTAHFIDKEWRLHKRIISFSLIEIHKAADIGDSIITKLKDWGLTSLFCCTMDNAYANDGAIGDVKSYLNKFNSNVLDGKYFHMRCVGHILNLIVQYGLEEIGTSVRRVREAVKWLTSSPKRILQWAKVVNILADRIDCKKALCLDVPTRWNSTYLMLQSAIPYEEAFQLYSQMYPSYKKDLSQKKHNDAFIGLLEGQDWINVKKMIEYLQKFYELTVLMSDTKYPTSHIFFAEMCDIFDLISELEVSDDHEISSMALKMRMKIGKYWAEDMELNPRMNRILYIAAVLDPRQKMNHVETCFKSIYRDARGEIMVRDVTYALNELFDYYVAQKEAQNPAQHQKDAANENMRRQGRSDRRGSLSLVGLRGNR